jgi:hypothetical protein
VTRRAFTIESISIPPQGKKKVRSSKSHGFIQSCLSFPPFPQAFFDGFSDGLGLSNGRRRGAGEASVFRRRQQEDARAQLQSSGIEFCLFLFFLDPSPRIDTNKQKKGTKNNDL